VDTLGLPHCLFVTTADVSDREGAIEMIKMLAPNLSSVASVLGDGGYTGANFADAVFSLIGAETQNGTNFTSLSSFQNAGLWKEALPGLITTAGFGRTAKGRFTPRYR
jgi:transposase